MKTRRGENIRNTGMIEPVGAAAMNPTIPVKGESAVVSGVTGGFGNDPSGQPSSIPTQQQRMLAQLRTSMINVNRKFGNAVTNEVLTQVIGALAFEHDEMAKSLNWKPEYSDVKIDTDLSNPPIDLSVLSTKQEHASDFTKSTPTSSRSSPKKSQLVKNVLQPFPSWFSFDFVSEKERSYFGPLFSMDEERWKMYLSMRNDIVRIYEDVIGSSALDDRYSVFLTSSDLRRRLHPKDDAAQIFELWKWLTDNGVINRGRKDDAVLACAKGVVHDIAVPVPSQPVTRTAPPTSSYTCIECSSCKRECKFMCYRPVVSDEAVGAEGGVVDDEDNPGVGDTADANREDMLDEEEIVDEMADDLETKKKIADYTSYMCHDCTPPHYERVPLRLFIDVATKERIISGDYEEVGEDDLKYFLVISDEESRSGESEETNAAVASQLASNVLAQTLFQYIFGNLSTDTAVKDWKSYLGKSELSPVKAQSQNVLETLDPLMQEALTGAGQKIRGSVLIEQQVRNMVYGINGSKDPKMEKQLNESDEGPCGPVSAETAFELITKVVAVTKELLNDLNSSIPTSVTSSPLFAHAKTVDKVHYNMLSLIYCFCVATAHVRNTIVNESLKFDGLLHAVDKRLTEKQNQLHLLKQQMARAEFFSKQITLTDPTKVATFKGDIFQDVDTRNIRLSSSNPKQLKLAQL